MKKYLYLSLLAVFVIAVAVAAMSKSDNKKVIQHEVTTPVVTDSDQLKQEQDEYKKEAVIKTKTRTPPVTNTDKFRDEGDTEPFIYSNDEI